MKYLFWVIVAVACLVPGGSDAQDTGIVTGVVTLGVSGEPLHGAVVILIGLGEFTTTDGEGRYKFEGVPPGSYDLLVEREHLSAERTTVVVGGGETVEASVALALSPIHEQITVTTSARGESTAMEQFNAITTLDSIELARDMAGNIGEALQNEAGVSKRSFGPAASRPIIRGFDGDRVLIMQDGTSTGDLSSQSGDHNVTIDPASLERIEVIRGPATLLYGSNAVGGVVNTITPHDSFRRSQPQGMRGQALFDVGTTNDQLGGNANVRYGNGRFMTWAGGGARRAGDYNTPEGVVENSASNLANGNVGAGYYGERAFLSFAVGVETGRFGVPGAGELHAHEDEDGHEEEGHEDEDESFQIDNDQHRQNLRFDVGLQDLQNDFIDSTRVVFQFIDWNHNEIEIEDGIESIGSTFNNDIFLLRAEVEQKRTGNLTGRFGFWAKHRDYEVTGAEALAPPTIHNALAGFIYEELAVGAKTTLSFGGRVENNDYNPDPRPDDVEGPPTPPRSFTGFSGSAGVRYDFLDNAAFVSNFTSSYRAPALEELYNFGRHVGNLAFEIGDPELSHEKITGLDFGVKGRGSGFDADFNVFYYDINDFVFADFQDEIIDGLRLAPFEQADSRFFGFDAQVNFRLAEYLWLKAGFGFVDAKFTETDEYLPRIPPFHGRVEMEIPYRSLTVVPELVWSARQDKVFRDELPTDGYTVLNIKAQYLLARTHVAHIFTVNAFNLTNELYAMHTNFIKVFAPEIGRGIKFTYSFRFF